MFPAPMIRRGAFLLALLPLLALLAGLPAQAKGIPLALVEIGSSKVLAEVPRSATDRYQGLGGRKSLAPGRGMLFFFYQGGPRTMCMRGMNFALDFIWLRAGRVSEISHRVPPAGADLAINPVGKADLVLEVPAGWAKDNGVRPGQAVSIIPLGKDFPGSLKARLVMERHESR